MPRSEALKQAQKRYAASDAGKAAHARSNKKNSKMFAFRLTFSTDADIIEWLDSLDNKAGYFKELIRADIARQSS